MTAFTLFHVDPNAQSGANTTTPEIIFFNVVSVNTLREGNETAASIKPNDEDGWFMLWGWLGMVAVLISSSELNFYIPPPDIWLIIILLGSFGGALPIFLFNWALGNIESTKVAVSIGFNPLVAALLGIRSVR